MQIFVESSDPTKQVFEKIVFPNWLLESLLFIIGLIFVEDDTFEAAHAPVDQSLQITSIPALCILSHQIIDRFVEYSHNLLGPILCISLIEDHLIVQIEQITQK